MSDNYFCSGVPPVWRSDNLSAATHQIPGGGRELNRRFAAVLDHCLRLDPHALSEDATRGDPTVDEPAVVPDLEALSLYRLAMWRYSLPFTLQRTMSSTTSVDGSTGSTVTSCPDSTRPFIDAPRGRSWTATPSFNFAM
jgi:hypothetical protein